MITNSHWELPCLTLHLTDMQLCCQAAAAFLCSMLIIHIEFIVSLFDVTQVLREVLQA